MAVAVDTATAETVMAETVMADTVMAETVMADTVMADTVMADTVMADTVTADSVTTDILVLGAGLSGLHTAYELQKQGLRYLLIEARTRLGGRILSRRLSSTAEAAGQPAFDLGPAWFWPGQHRMESLMVELALQDDVLDQFGDGDSIYEDPAGQLRRGMFGAGMQGSYRLRGGIGQLIDALAAGVPDSKVRLGWEAEAIRRSADLLETTVRTADGPQTMISKEVVVALPPRIAEQRIRLEPEATPGLRRVLRETPTWMAGQGKLVALYERPFWRQQGLSGDAISHRGPLGEIHDISPNASGVGAFFGFFAIPALQRGEDKELLKRACIAQLTRLFGESASQPIEVFLKDWAFDPRTATADDREKMEGHCERDFKLPESDPWHDRILWSGSETASVAQRFNGYLEGALEASQHTIRRLVERVRDS